MACFVPLINRDRVLANRFMDMAAGMALGSLNKHIADLSTQVSPAGQRQIMQIMQMARMGQGMRVDDIAHLS